VHRAAAQLVLTINDDISESRIGIRAQRDHRTATGGRPDDRQVFKGYIIATDAVERPETVRGVTCQKQF
jgi:hypothetical protein